MIKQTLTKMELEATVKAMAERDFGSEIMLEIVEDLEYDEELDYLDEYDYQPSEYDEWQDFYGGDDSYQGESDCKEY